MTLDMRYPTPLPSTKGWGPGYPNCQRDKILPHDIFQGGLRKEIFELVELLVGEMQRRGYVFRDGWSWGFGCRATKGGDGDVPSFHSWGLALDINAPLNPFGAPTNQNMPKWVVDLMAEYGFFWLGPSIKDWMHFHFAGSPADAKAMTEKARKELGAGGDDVAFEDFKTGINKFRQGKPRPADPGDERFGWDFAQYAARNPKPDVPAPHNHPHTHQVSEGG